MAAHMNRALSLRSQGLWALTRPVVATPQPQVGQNGSQPCRGFPTSKHWDIKFRELRKKKVLKIDLPKFIELRHEKKRDSEKSADELRMDMKKEGKLPPRMFQELPLNFSSTRSVIDQYEPPAGDGKQSFLSGKRVKEFASQKPKTIKHVRRLKKYEDFNEAEFAEEAHGIVVAAQGLLQDVYENQDALHDLVTEKAFPEMVHGLENKTVRWQMVETVEPTKVVHIRTEEMMSSDNVFAQVTVRMHTKQILAVYDRFGRLMYGDPNLPKSVVEYVILEKWISDTYGRWRIHGKIVPDWMPPRDFLRKSYKVPTFEPLPPVEEEKKVEKKEDDGGGDDDDDKNRGGPKLAVA